MRCINCGTEIPKNQRYCGYSGAPQPVPERTAHVKSTKSGQLPAGSRTWIFLGAGDSSIIACTVCIVALILMPWFYKRVPMTEAPQEEQLTPSIMSSAEVTVTPNPTLTEIAPTLI